MDMQHWGACTDPDAPESSVGSSRRMKAEKPATVCVGKGKEVIDLCSDDDEEE
jgi:hypothetical protein